MTTARSRAKLLEVRSLNPPEAFESFLKLLDEFCESEGLVRGEQVRLAQSATSQKPAEGITQGERPFNGNDSEQVKAS
jgi:hypothetical protein